VFISNQLFHIRDLSPKSLSELKHLDTLLEYTVVYLINNQLANTGILLPGIHCNSTPIEHQRHYMESAFLITDKPEFESISRSIQRFIETVIEQYRVYNKYDPLSELNIQINLINKTTVLLSYDMY